MTTDFNEDGNEQPSSISNSDESENSFNDEKINADSDSILTTAIKSKIKIIKNPECKSWTYHKGDQLK